MIKKKHIPQWKSDEINYLIELFKQYKNVAVIEVAHINDRQIQEIRKILRDKAIIRMSKRSLQVRAIEQYQKESKKTNLIEFAKSIPGQSSLVFSNIDIFKLKRAFNENEWMVPAKPNEITPVDIWVPAGDTGFPTGQVISELNVTLRLPTRIQNDTIWIREDTRTHKAGDLVDVKQAAVLKKLGVKPIKSLIKIHFAWRDGEIIPEEVLYMDIESFQKNVASSFLAAQNLAIELGVMDEDIIEPLLKKARREALALLFEMPFFDENMIEDYIKKAISIANNVNSIISTEATITSTKSKKSKTGKKKKKKQGSDSPGIGGLFSN
ncbi:MAG: 50S ribosomal protein L10 [Promethearchaeota archaeon]